MRPRALLAPLAAALVACLDPSSASNSPPSPAPSVAPALTSWPTAAPYDLDADVHMRASFARSHWIDGADVIVQDGVFVLAGAAELRDVDDAAPRTHEALAALLHGRFARLPSHAITVYVLHNHATFTRICGERLGHECPPKWLGIWIKETREILVDQSLGPTSLVHELVHPMLENEAPTLPRWLREGISALMEQPSIQGLEIHGTTNWRVADLRRALASPTERELVHLDALFRMPDDLFDGDHALAAYAVVRFACQWMDSAGQDRLWHFYQSWRDHVGDGATGEKAFADVFGQSPHDADAAWQKWVRSL